MDENEKSCRTCISNDCGICDRTGVRTEDGNICHRWRGESWQESLMKIFLRRR